MEAAEEICRGKQRCQHAESRDGGVEEQGDAHETARQQDQRQFDKFAVPERPAPACMQDAVQTMFYGARESNRAPDKAKRRQDADCSPDRSNGREGMFYHTECRRRNVRGKNRHHGLLRVTALDKPAEQNDNTREQREQRHHPGIGNGSCQHKDVVSQQTLMEFSDHAHNALRCQAAQTIVSSSGMAGAPFTLKSDLVHNLVRACNCGAARWVNGNTSTGWPDRVPAELSSGEYGRGEADESTSTSCTISRTITRTAAATGSATSPPRRPMSLTPTNKAMMVRSGDKPSTRDMSRGMRMCDSRFMATTKKTTTAASCHVGCPRATRIATAAPNISPTMGMNSPSPATTPMRNG